MAILFRTISDLTIGGMSARLTAYVGGGRMRVEIEPYNSAGTAYTNALNVQVKYNGVTQTLSADSFTEAVSVMFTHKPTVKSLTLSSSAEISYGGSTSSTSRTFSWKGDGTVPEPTLRISYYSGLITDKVSRIEWEIGNVPDGYTAYVLGVWYNKGTTAVSPTYKRTEVVSGKTTNQFYQHTIANLARNVIVYYRIAVGLYPSSTATTAGREDYVVYAEIDSPEYVCSGSNLALISPYNVRCSGVTKDYKVTIRWDTLPNTQASGVYIGRGNNGKESWYSMAYIPSPENSYTTTVSSSWTNFAFRIMSYAYNSNGNRVLGGEVYTKWMKTDPTNVYVGHNGIVTPVREIWVGSKKANPIVHVG